MDRVKAMVLGVEKKKRKRMMKNKKKKMGEEKFNEWQKKKAEKRKTKKENREAKRQSDEGRKRKQQELQEKRKELQSCRQQLNESKNQKPVNWGVVGPLYKQKKKLERVIKKLSGGRKRTMTEGRKQKRRFKACEEYFENMTGHQKEKKKRQIAKKEEKKHENWFKRVEEEGRRKRHKTKRKEGNKTRVFAFGNGRKRKKKRKTKKRKKKLNFGLIGNYPTRGVPRELLKKTLASIGVVILVDEAFTSRRCYFCKKVERKKRKRFACKF